MRQSFGGTDLTFFCPEADCYAGAEWREGGMSHVIVFKMSDAETQADYRNQAWVANDLYFPRIKPGASLKQTK